MLEMQISGLEPEIFTIEHMHRLVVKDMISQPNVLVEAGVMVATKL